MLFPPEGPRWETDGRDWPNRSASSFVPAQGLTWHVQRMGHGPVLLLLHGAGAATHSWRDLMPRLAEHFTVVAPDLPGHGFTQPLPFYRLTLPGMAAAVAGLMVRLRLRPAMVVGHSAGAAIAARMALDGSLRPELLVSLNGALQPFKGMAGHVFPGMAKLLFVNPLTPRLFAWGAADARRVTRLIVDTGSTLDPAGLALYARLFRSPGHVSGALGMMAGWDLDTLARDLPRLAVPLVLVAAENDRAIAPAQGRAVARQVPGARLVSLSRLGHLAHEEAPEEVAALLVDLAREAGLLNGGRPPAAASGGAP